MPRAIPLSLWTCAALLTCPLLLVSCALWGKHIPEPIEPELVIVDASERAYSVFTVAPLQLSNTELEALYARTELLDGVDVMTWTKFLEEREIIFDACVRQNDYPGSRAREGLPELLTRYAGIPFGMTWNGGIAFTFQDYQFAKRTYELFVADPGALEAGSGYVPEQDPLQPKLHFGPLLGWK